MEYLRSKTTRAKTPVLAIILRVPMKNVSPYLNPYISAELLRIKTTKLPSSQVKLMLSQSKEKNPQQAEQGHAQMQQCV
jgi:hypothetical protein